MKQFSKAFSSSKADPVITGVIRQRIDDFKVNEIASFTPSGEGEHVYLQIEKTGENTDWVAGLLAKIAAVPRRDVSYAGMKDRHAITTQWFSIQMAGRKAPDWQVHLPDSIKVQQETRHSRKLRRGALKGNEFTLVIRDIEGDLEAAKSCCEKIKQQGVPNYYGEQRFGRDFNNIQSAKRWFAGDFKPKSRTKRSIYLSAARSWLFNHLLSQRVEQGTWNQALTGDVFMLAGCQSCFADDGDMTLKERVKQHDLHPTGALWGKGLLKTTADMATLEQQIATALPDLAKGLEEYGLKQERRSLRLLVNDFSYHIDTDKITLSFILSSGSFATVVLRELGEVRGKYSANRLC
ncbi:MAG: tRNA pseudouridine(13) synthase TruD [Cocleimonas sp.]|nr:tRNA pseudouridine(13) synthase TruD [Cocleimonas sp.]